MIGMGFYKILQTFRSQFSYLLQYTIDILGSLQVCYLLETNFVDKSVNLFSWLEDFQNFLESFIYWMYFEFFLTHDDHFRKTYDFPRTFKDI